MVDEASRSDRLRGHGRGCDNAGRPPGWPTGRETATFADVRALTTPYWPGAPDLCLPGRNVPVERRSDTARIGAR